MGGVPQLPFGLSTSPGALPVVEVDDAVDLALGEREFPTVPTLATPAASLLAQAATAFEGVHLLPTGELRVDRDRFGVDPDAAALLDAEPFRSLTATLAAWPAVVCPGAARPSADRQRADRQGPERQGLRVDMTGPVTLALDLLRAGVPEAQALDAVRVASVCRAEALVAAVRGVEPHRTVAVVMSEPRLVGAMHPTFALSVRQVRSLLDPVVDAVDRAAGSTPVLIGVHVPGPSDWRTIVTSGVSLVSMPPDAGLAGWAPWVQALLDNGGFVAWGAVPVDRPLGTGEELLWRQLAGVWRDLAVAGVDPVQLRRRSLVGPADGLGHFAPEQVTHMQDLVDALGERIRRQVAGTRLGLGA